LSFTPHRAARWPAASLAALCLGAEAACPGPAVDTLLERFIAADCDSCWATGSAAATAPGAAPFVLDWIVPSLRGDDAALSPAALVEATARAGALPPAGQLQRRQVMPLQRGLRVSVQDGPAWSGYIAVSLHVEWRGAALPAGAVGYLALVENVPAGEEGTPIERRLVRALAGPLLLDGALTSTSHLHALRIPPGARPERLAGVGWVEGPSGKVIALTTATRDNCGAATRPDA
jgi:hypothetical protein